jgi:hypothetical protein
MTLTEKYLFLFVDTFCSNLALSITDGFAVGVMKDFGYVGFQMLSLTFLGIVCAGVVNYLFGRVLYNIFVRYMSDDNLLRYKNIKSIWDNYHFIWFWLCFIPDFAKVMLVVCGFIRFKFMRSIFFLAFFKGVYYLNELGYFN